jgi:hypothetical protein
MDYLFCRDNDNARLLRSTLNLTKVTEQDYDVIYTCWSFIGVNYGQGKQVKITKPGMKIANNSHKLHSNSAWILDIY